MPCFVRTLDKHDLRLAVADTGADLSSDRGRMMPYGKPVDLLRQNLIHARNERIEIERSGPHGVYDR